MPHAPDTLSPNDVARAHARLIEHGVVHMQDRAQAVELVSQLPPKGRPYFVKGGRVWLGNVDRADRLERLGPAPRRS